MTEMDIPHSDPGLRSVLPDLLLLVLLLAAGWLYLFQVQQVMDIGLSDESVYLGHGVSIPEDGLPDAECAPLYSLWYWALSLLESDRVQLYFLNYKILSVLPLLLLYAALRSHRVPRLAAFLITAAGMLSAANFPVWPKVSHFAVMLLLGGFSAAAFVRNPVIRSALMALAALLASYARPELFLSFALMAGYAGWLARHDLPAFRARRGLLAGLAAFAVATILIFGMPVGSGERSVAAFGQHYALNKARVTHSELNPWTHWREIAEEDFGAISNVGGALLTHPRAFLRHAAANARHLPSALEGTFLRSFPTDPASTLALRVGLLVFLCAGVLRWRRRGAPVWPDVKRRLVLHRSLSLLVLSVCLPVLLSSLLIFPRQHYLVIGGMLLIAWGAVLLLGDETTSRGRGSDAPAYLAGLVLLFAVRPIVTQVRDYDRNNQRTIRFLQTLAIQKPVHLLEAEGGYAIYLGSNYRGVAPAQKDGPFPKFMDEEGINMVAVTEELLRDARLRSDPDWSAFVENPLAYGYATLAIPEVDQRSLLVHRSLIPAAYQDHPDRSGPVGPEADP